MAAKIIAVLAVVAIGCSPTNGWHIHPSSGWSVSGPTYAGASTNLPASATFLLLSDTHASSALAPHDLKSNNYLIDSVVGAAVRPPQMDLWGLRVLAWILDAPPKVEAILHLGDVANIACADEFESFAAEMLKARAPWFLTPGNHDSLLMGNWAYELAGPRSRWAKECNSKAGTMDKKVLLDRYVATKGWDLKPYPNRTPGYDCREVTEEKQGVVARAVVCHRCPPRAGDSRGFEWGDFIVQTVEVSNTVALLLDTTDYREKPRLKRLGGAWGGFSAMQSIVAKAMMAERRAEWSAGQIAQKFVIVGTHYPIDALDGNSQAEFQGLVETIHPLGVFTGHTHFPTAERDHSMTASAGKFLEVNVASAIGWPPEFSYVTITATAKPTLELTVAGSAHLLAKPGGLCDPWRDSELFDHQKYDYYTHYARPDGYARLRRHMFEDAAARLRARGYAGDVPVFDETSGEEKPVPIVGSIVFEFELCEAIFASAADSHDELRFLPAKPAATGTPSMTFVEDAPAEHASAPLRPAGADSQTVTWTFTELSPSPRP